MTRPNPLRPDCVVLFTKPAVPGNVKTRLVGRLTAEQTAALHAAFVRDTSASLSRGNFDLVVAWALRPGRLPDTDLVPHGVSSMVQEGPDLGQRLFGALKKVGQSGYDRVAAVGSDHPGLPSQRLEEAFTRLHDVDVVLGPVDDGGYDLIAVRTPSLTMGLFDGISWSTDTVLQETLERAAALGLSVSTLGLGFDVDTPEDLDQLIRRLQDDALRSLCPNTVNLLEKLGLLVARDALTSSLRTE